MNDDLTQDKPQFTRLARELQECGWREIPLEILGDELFFQTFQGGRPAPCRRFESQKGQGLLLIGLEQVLLPGEADLFPRFLNLPMETRMALSVARLLGEPDWLLLLTGNRVELFRLPGESCELRSGTGDELEEAMLPTLAALARGRDEGAWIEPSHLPEAESLRDWIQHWSMQLASPLKVEPAAVQRLIWKWIIMLQVQRRTEASEMQGGWGLACEQRAGRWIASYNAATATDDLCRILEAFDQRFTTKLFDTQAARHIQWLRALEETTLIDQLRAELLMQTQSRFEPETVAWVFTDLHREQEGWRREVGGIEPIRERFSHEGWNIFRPLTIDVGHYGLTTALRDTDRLAQYLNDLSLFMRERRLASPSGTVGQLDLFCQNPRGIGPGGELEDGLNFLFGETLRLKGIAPERRFGLGVTFILKALALVQKMDWPFCGINTLDDLIL